jgi:serine/threonine-protein kinase
VPAVVRPLHIDVLVLGDRMVPFLALEWLEGEALDQIIDKRRILRKAPIGIRTLVPFLQPAAQALAQAHQVPTPTGPLAIIHRDIKPDNIFVARGPEGETVKILDFGIARTRSAAQLDAGAMTSQTALDSFTPGYAAPEQWMPKRFGQIGPWTDVYGLALTMVEALTGKPPFEGELRAVAQGATDPRVRPTPRTLGATVPDEVERAFARALAVDPRERTPSIGAFWTELEAALGLTPTIRLPDAAARARPRSLSEASEPPPPMSPAPVPAASKPSAPSPLSAPVPNLSRVRPAGGEAPPPSRAEAAAEARFDLVKSPAAIRDAHAIRLAAEVRRERGTMASPSTRRGLGELSEQLRTPATLLGAAIVMTVADVVHTKITGDLFTVASLRPIWVTGTLALLGVGLACWRLLAGM